MNIIRNVRGFHAKRKLFTARTTIVALLTCLFTAILGSFLPVGPTAFASNPAVWSLVWSDEFDGPSGSAGDSSKGRFDLFANGSRNNELAAHPNSTADTGLDGVSLVHTAPN